MKNYYQVLEIKERSSLSKIKKAYKSLALKHHPDRGGEIRKMQEINVAYEHLMKNKESYDWNLGPSKPNLRTQGFTITVGGYDMFTTGASWTF